MRPLPLLVSRGERRPRTDLFLDPREAVEQILAEVGPDGVEADGEAVGADPGRDRDRRLPG